MQRRVQGYPARAACSLRVSHLHCAFLCSGLDSTLETEPHSLGTPLSHFRPKLSSDDAEGASEVATVVNIESIKRSLMKEDQFARSPPAGDATSPSPTKRNFANDEVKLRDKSWRERRRSRDRPLSAALVETAMSPTSKDPPVFLEKGKTTTKDSPEDLVVPERESKESGRGELPLGKETNGQLQPGRQSGCSTAAVSSDARTAVVEQRESVLLTGTQALQIFHRRRKARDTTSDNTPPTTPDPELPHNGDQAANPIPPTTSSTPSLLVASSTPVESLREDVSAGEPPAATAPNSVQECHHVQENGIGSKEEGEEKEEEGKEKEREGEGVVDVSQETKEEDGAEEKEGEKEKEEETEREGEGVVDVSQKETKKEDGAEEKEGEKEKEEEEKEETEREGVGVVDVSQKEKEEDGAEKKEGEKEKDKEKEEKEREGEGVVDVSQKETKQEEEEEKKEKKERRGEGVVDVSQKEASLRVGPPRLTTQVSGRSILNDKRMKMLALSLEGTLVDSAPQKINTGRVGALQLATHTPARSATAGCCQEDLCTCMCMCVCCCHIVLNTYTHCPCRWWLLTRRARRKVHHLMRGRSRWKLN